MISVSEVLPLLEGVRRKGKEISALCPAHDDHKPSLTVTEGKDGKALLHCFAGCSFEQILSSVNLNFSSGERREVATYDYRDETGKLLYQSVRYEPKDFRLRKPDGKGGFDWNLNGTPRVLYRFPELLAANPARTVLVVEGEADADMLTALGLVATTNAGGAGKWRADFNEAFRGRKVVIIPDNDEPGRKHAAHVGSHLVGVASSLKVLKLPGLPEKGDVSDWLNAGGTVSELRTLVNDTAPFEPESESNQHIFTGYSEFMEKRVNDGELVAFECYRGEVALIQSITNKFKSTLIRNSSFCLAAGREFLPLVPGRIPRRVLLLNFEGSCGRFQSDLRVMERVFTDAEMESVKANLFPAHAPELNDEPLSLSRHLPILLAEARAIKPDVVVIDTASAAFSIRHESDNSEIAELQKSVVRFARNLNCVAVMLTHIGKAKAEDGQTREAAHRGRGASAWADFASAIFNLDHDQNTDLVTLTCAKRKSGTGENYESVLLIDREARWLSATSEAPPRPLTHREMVLGVLSDDSLTTAGIEQLLAGKMSERTVRSCLKQLVEDGLATQPKRGYWKIREHESELGKSGNTHRGLPNCLTGNKANNSNGLDHLGKLGNTLYELPDLPNEVDHYQEPTKEELQRAALDPDEWRRLEAAAEARA